MVGIAASFAGVLGFGRGEGAAAGTTDETTGAACEAWTTEAALSAVLAVGCCAGASEIAVGVVGSRIAGAACVWIARKLVKIGSNAPRPAAHPATSETAARAPTKVKTNPLRDDRVTTLRGC